MSTNKKVVETNPQDVYIKDTKVSVKTVMEYEDVPVPPEENHPPVADAGIDQTVLPKSSVILDGSKSYDPDAGDVITFQWTQKSGPNVTLQNSNTSKATFTAPDITPPPPVEETQLEPVSIIASNEEVGKEARLVNDDDYETRWSAEGQGEWIEFIFDKPYNVTKVKLTGYHYDKAYYFEINGQRFECPANRQPDTLMEYDLKSLNINDSTVRIIGYGNNDTDYNSYREIHFYTGGIPPPPPTGEQPVAVIKPDVLQGQPSTILTVDGSQSKNAAKYLWDVDGDLILVGAVDGPTTQFKIVGGQGCVVNLTVTNNQGKTNTVSKQVIVTDEPPPPPPPNGDVLWDSNIHLKVDKETKVTSTFGSQEINGKGVWMAASGNPRLIIRPNGEFDLQADSGHGRVYIQCQNYNAMYEGEVRFNDNAIRNTTWRLRSRHNEGGACENRFGGFGATCEMEEQLAEYATESCHNNHENTIKKALAKKMEVGKWLKFRFAVCDAPDKKSVKFKTEYDYGDGKGWVTVLEGSHNSPQDYYIRESDFLQKRSYTWLRVNNESTGSVTYRNLKIIKIDRIPGTSSSEPRRLLASTTTAAEAEDNTLTFELKVTDQKGLSNTDTVSVTVKQEIPPPPECPPGQHRDPVTGQCVPDVEPPPGEKWVLGIVGDTHGRTAGHNAMSALKQKHNAAFIIHTGDITDTESDDDGYIAFTKSLNLTYGKDFANSQGNHESKEESGEGAQGDMEAAFPVLKENEWLQFYHIKNAVIIFGNTQAPGYSQLDSNAGKWLKDVALPKAKQLVDSKQADWIFYAQHKPVYTLKARHESEFNFRYNFHPIFDQYGVDISFHGHNHDQQRTLPLMFGGNNNAPPKVNSKMKGDAHDLSTIPHGNIVSINGSSSKLTSFSESPNAWTPYANDQDNGYTIIEIDGKNLTGKYIETSSGNVLHEFKATKA